MASGNDLINNDVVEGVGERDFASFFIDRLPTLFDPIFVMRCAGTGRPCFLAPASGRDRPSLNGFTEFYWVLLGFTEFYWVLLGFTGFYWILLGFIVFYWVLTVFYWVSPCFTGFYWV